MTSRADERRALSSAASVPHDAEFTPNPDRAIWIDGKFTEALLVRLRPQILELTSSSREPITVFINSSGGAPEVAEEILKLLRPSQDGATALKIITVAATKAESMGANFLSSGDFAIASPGCTLLYHGGRWPLSELVNAGAAGRLYAHSLPVFNEKNAAVLMQNSVRRFLFIVRAFRPRFAEHPARADDPTITDVEILERILHAKLSPAGQAVLERALRLWHRQNVLFVRFQKKLRRGRSVTKEQLRKLMLYSAFECECEPAAWDAGLPRICDEFYFLSTYFDLGSLREYVAGRREPQTAATDAEADYLLPFQMFLLALCRALQEGENCITPLDALYLGLVDTVETAKESGPRSGEREPRRDGSGARAGGILS
jgi:hypothetical protein